jgi:6-phosphogluconate dehydrogenase
MQIALVGLGRMGLNMARRLLRGGHQVVAYNRTFARTQEFMQEGGAGAATLEELVTRLAPPRTLWLMLPEGAPTEEHIQALSALLSPGDLLVDGGNTFFRDDLRRAEALAPREMHYCDAGVSGGVWGLEQGYCLMLGGAEEDFRRLEPALATLAPPEGYLHCGPVGAGHFVKMVHNGIEYAMMEAYGEGLELLRASPYGETLDLRAVAHLWQRGSVVRSWLLELLEDALAKDPDLAAVAGYVEDSGEGRWAVQQAVELGVAADGMAHAVFKRFLSRQTDAFSNRVLAALRNEFGGHAVLAAGEAARATGAGAGEAQPAQPAEGARR